MTRVQRERFFNEEEYLRLKDSYILTPEKLTDAPDDMIIMHPLPRVNDISVGIDADPRACYFKQVLNGKYMRMALILALLEGTLDENRRNSERHCNRSYYRRERACALPASEAGYAFLPGGGDSECGEPEAWAARILSKSMRRSIWIWIFSAMWIRTPRWM